MNPLIGIQSIITAFGLLLKHPSLILLSSLLGLVACVISVTGLWFVLDHSDVLRELLLDQFGLRDMIAEDGWVKQAIDYLLKGLGVLLTLLLMPWIISLIGFPLCTPLADRTDHLLGGESTELDFMQSIWASIALNLKITVTGIIVGLTLYLLGWIPVIGLVFSAISAFVWTPLVMSLNVFENTLTRRGLTFGEMCRLIGNHPIESILVGGQTMILVAVPVLNLVGLPIAVISGVIAIRTLEANGAIQTLNLESNSTQ
ncbi:MAG: EI24 domain-containing protein [Bradymonadia bacterium]